MSSDLTQNIVFQVSSYAAINRTCIIKYNIITKCNNNLQWVARYIIYIVHAIEL